MCTVTIHRVPGRIVATMNRDEAFARAPESPPAIVRGPSGVEWMAPRDGERGGTWMGANSAGVIACLLNAYQPGESLLPDTSGQFRSRGEIIPALLERGPADAALAWLSDDFDPEQYPSFTLLVVSDAVARKIAWLRNGRLDIEPIQSEWTLVSSSGWDSAEVTRWREAEFARWLDGDAAMRGTLPEFHLLQPEGKEDWAPLMNRGWSATRSITQAHFDSASGTLAMHYWRDPTPASNGPSASVALERISPTGIAAR